MTASTAQTVVLLSGGIDSSTVLAHYLDRPSGDRSSVSALFFDYGQPALRSEWKAAKAIARHYDVPLRKERLAFKMAARRGEYFGRNALFSLIAAARLGWNQAVIATGLHAGSYYDTTPAFIADVQRILDGYAAGTSILTAPFATQAKADIVRWAQEHDVPLHLTYSCQRRDHDPCGRCLSCQERRALLAA